MELPPWRSRRTKQRNSCWCRGRPRRTQASDGQPDLPLLETRRNYSTQTFKKATCVSGSPFSFVEAAINSKLSVPLLDCHCEETRRVDAAIQFNSYGVPDDSAGLLRRSTPRNDNEGRIHSQSLATHSIRDYTNRDSVMHWEKVLK